MSNRLLDLCIQEVDRALRVITGDLRLATRPSPAALISESSLSSEEQQQIAGLMRVNHAGEICAQALYQGQALTAKLTQVREQMENAAAEEWDHLAWCEARLQDVNAKPSVLNPIWFLGALSIGALAGFIGDRWSLAFVAETERQVILHLQEHLEKLPAQDAKSRAILEKMQEEEAEHGLAAKNAGAAEFPPPIQWLMNRVSKVMTTASYYL